MHLDNTTPFETEFTLAFDSNGREMVVVVVKGTYDFPGEPTDPARISPAQYPLVMADELGPEPGLAPIIETDFAPFKPRCDVMVLSNAYAPNGQEAKRVVVGMQCGDVKKAFQAVGPRLWHKGAMGFYISEAQPFKVQPISYEQAWGGVDPHPSKKDVAATYETNPAGVGYYPYRDDLSGLAVPSTEAMDELVESAEGKYTPMAFGPIGRTWLPRRQYAGTYDEAWQENRMPFPPMDLDPLFHQSAPPDQQMSYPKGGEVFRLQNLSPEGKQEGRLPGTRVVMRFERKKGRITQKVGHLDTVVFFPEARKLTLTWRTHLIPDKDMFELKRCTVIAEEREVGRS